nr:histone deacetylase complex subunit CTI6-like [Aedes albopictus]
MSSRGSKSDGKGSKASGKSERPKAKDGEVISELVGDKGSDDVVVVEEGKEKTVDGYTCKTCGGGDTDDMVQCDQCDGWHHYNCVGVTDEVVNQSWSCTNCKTATWNQRTTSTSGEDPAPKDVHQQHSSKRASSQKRVSTTGPESPSNGNPPSPKSTDPTVHPSHSSRHMGNPSPGAPPTAQMTGKKLFVPSLEGLPAIQLDEASSEVSCSSSQRSARNRAKLQLQRLEEERVFEEQQAERRRVAEQLEAEKHKAFLDKKYQILEELASERGSSRCSSSVYSRSRVENWVEKGRNSEVMQQSNEQPARRERSQPDLQPAQREFDQLNENTACVEPNNPILS